LRQTQRMAIHSPTGGAVGQWWGAENRLETAPGLGHFGLDPGVVGRQHAALPKHAIPGVNGDLETGSQRLAHAVGSTRADIGSRQEQPRQACGEIVVTAGRGLVRFATAAVRTESEEEGGRSGVPLQQVNERRDADQRSAAGVDVDLEGDALHRTGTGD